MSPPVPMSDYQLIPTSLKGDITPMINKNASEETLALKKIKTSLIDTLSPAYTFQHYTNKTQNLKLIMHCDSFSDAWIPFFNESFGETVYVRTFELDQALIEKIQPDIVIFEIVERNLVTLLNKKTPKINRGSFFISINSILNHTLCYHSIRYFHKTGYICSFNVIHKTILLHSVSHTRFVDERHNIH